MRLQVIRLLKEKPRTAQDIATYLNIDVKEVFEDLDYIKRSDVDLKYSPAKCKECGFQFKDRKTFKTPSKCPRCKSESIQPVYFKID